MARAGKREPVGLGYRPLQLTAPSTGLPGAGFGRSGPLGIGRQLHAGFDNVIDLPFPADMHLQTRWFLMGDRRYEEFRQIVLDRQIKRARARGGEFLATIPDSELAEVERGHKLLKPAAAQCRALLAKARAELKAGAGENATIGLASSYRTVAKEAVLWNTYFENYYLATKDHRWRLPGGEFSEAAIEFMVKYVGKRKAAPGYSNHSAGIAVDFRMAVGRHGLGANMKQKKAWRSSWLFGWLGRHAKTFHFRPYEEEPWHWEYKP